MFSGAELERGLSRNLEVLVGDDIGRLAVEDAQGGGRCQGGTEARSYG